MSKVSGRDLKPFLGAEDYETSLAFYKALGWRLSWNQGTLAELELGDCRFYLQRYYQREWCHNTMIHLTVDDAAAWFERCRAVLAERAYGAARVRAPRRADYGALVTHLWDPSGILWHLAQPLDE